MVRPRIKIHPSPQDKLVTLLGWLAVAITIAVPMYYYNSLPEMIPEHYGPDGLPDDYAPKANLYMLPTLSLLMYVGLTYIKTIPHHFNYLTEITIENAERQYTIGYKLINIIATFLAVLFAYIMIATIQVAIGERQGLGGSFLYVILGATTLIVGVSMWRSVKLK